MYKGHTLLSIYIKKSKMEKEEIKSNLEFVSKDRDKLESFVRELMGICSELNVYEWPEAQEDINKMREYLTSGERKREMKITKIIQES